MNTKTDCFALKAEIRSRQAACTALNIEIWKTKAKLAKLHKKLVTEYIAEHGSRMWKAGERSGCQKMLDQHPTYQSLKAEIQSLYSAKWKQRVDWTLHLAHCYLKGNTYEGSGAGNYNWNPKDIAKWIPGSDDETILCLTLWTKKREITRQEIEAFGVEEETLHQVKGILMNLKLAQKKENDKGIDLLRDAQRARNWLDDAQRSYDQASKDLSAHEKACREFPEKIAQQEQVIADAEKALQAKRDACFGKVA